MECDQYLNYYYDYIESANAVPEGVSEHIASCECCRRRIGQLQAELQTIHPIQAGIAPLLAMQMRLLDQWVSCGSCKPFLPLLLSKQLRLRVETPIQGHVDHCPACRDDVSSLRSLSLTDAQLLEASAWLAGDPVAPENPGTLSVLQAIAERRESPILTRSSLPLEDGQEGTLKTEVRRTAGPTGTLTAAALVQRWAKPVSAAAAILFIAAIFYFQAPQAQGFSLRRLYHAVGQVHTACIKSFYPNEDTEPQDEWLAEGAAKKQICVSDPLGLILYKSGGQAVLVDQADGIKYIHENGLTVQEPLADFGLVQKPWGLLPFNSLSHLPPGYEWQESDVEPLPLDEGITVYDLTWSTESVKKLWRGYLNAEGLPVRIEFWDQLPSRSAQLMMVMEIDYPSLEQVKAIIRNEGFQGGGNPIIEP